MAAALGLLLVAGVESASGQNNAAPVVSTPHGQVSGVRQGRSVAYLGIPFAQPPVGDLRWRPPEAASSWQGVRDGKEFPLHCASSRNAPGALPPNFQLLYTPEFSTRTQASEDCLKVDVWVPATPAKKPLPVMVWIHGGAFTGGGGDVPIYNGASLAARGAVVVTVHYRLGRFGFMAHPELTAESPRHTSGNYGLLDMIAALKWVKSDIKAFGGDPKNVTLFGQSAGAIAIDDLLMSPDAAGLFHRAIAESGPNRLSPLPLASAEAMGLKVQTDAGVHSLAEMRAMPTTVIGAIVNPTPPDGSRGVAPVLDGEVIPANPADTSVRPAVTVPYLAGYNRDEAESATLGETVSPAEFEARVRKRFDAFADRVLAVYPHRDQAEASRSAYLLPRDYQMARLVLWAAARAKASGQHVYPYQFDHAYAGPNSARFGAFHSAEIPYVFGVLDSPGRDFTPQDHAISERVQDIWLAFARTGKPTPDAPDARAGTAKVLELGDHFGPQDAVSTPARLAVLRAIYLANPKP
jgi:para-nitrobenzyl esterase